MNTLRSRIAKTLRHNSIGLFLFAGLALVTALALGTVKNGLPPLSALGIRSGLEPVTLSGTLSQTKIVQNGDQTIFLDVVVEVASDEAAAAPHAATDIIVVLDRSGSMGAANKLPYARAALRDIVSRLGPGDRFALISFANQAVVHTPLTAVTLDQREALYRMIAAIHAGGGTNLSEGLVRAMALVEESSRNRTRTVMLLSDGEANQGITHPDRLAEMARHLAAREAVLSTIGMGLGFNETLMASLADHGMGKYAYLEHLNGLDRILAADLNTSRQIFAGGSHLEIRLGDNVDLLDAGGYPIEKASGALLTVPTGQLSAHSRKRFIMTFQVPNDRIAEFPLADITLVYDRQQNQHRIRMEHSPLMLAVVAPEHHEEAVRSIDAATYKKSWLKNNLGRMQNSLSRWLREGKKEKAERALTDYRSAIKSAAAAAPLASKELDTTLDEMETTIEDAFSGSLEAQQVKRNRAAKSLQYRARQEQRTAR